jgi:hypothetical protein
VVAEIDDEGWIRETELVNGSANFPGQIEESEGCFARWIFGKACHCLYCRLAHENLSFKEEILLFQISAITIIALFVLISRIMSLQVT